MNKRQKIVVSVTGIFLVLLLLVGLTYAYFLTKINGNENTKSISVTTANLALVYGDGNGIISAEKIQPGTTLNKKEFTVKNEGNDTTDYVVVIEDVKVTNVSNGSTTTFESNDFIYTLTCKEGCNGVNTETTFPMTGGILVGNSIEVGVTHTYELTVTYKETGLDQSNDMNKKLEAKVNIADPNGFNPYVVDKGSLAYTIINNAIFGKNGTTLSDSPETIPAVSVSNAVNTGKYGKLTMVSSMMPYGFGPWNYADTENGAMSGTSASGKTCSDLIGKYIYDQSQTFTEVLKVESCEGEIPVVNQEIIDYETILTITEDDYGTSYYYRGAVEDNYIEFNNMCWRIVRIEGDGAIKITLAAQKACSSITSDDVGTAFIGAGDYGYTYDYVTNSNGETSSSLKNILNYINGQTTTSSMKIQFDKWLTSSGIDTSKLKKDEWCLGNTTDPYNLAGTLLTDSINDLMYNSASFYYDTYRRLYGTGTIANATLRCDGSNYKTHESYIGTLTADEVIFAGGKVETQNQNYYLIKNTTANWWWTLSPSYFYSNDSHSFLFHETGKLISEYAGNAFALRPAVSLLPGTQLDSGDGSISNPYTIK